MFVVLCAFLRPKFIKNKSGQVGLPPSLVPVK